MVGEREACRVVEVAYAVVPAYGYVPSVDLELAVVAGGDCDANHARDLDADKHILGMFPEELGLGRCAAV